MCALSTEKLYTIEHQWQSGRDLRVRCMGQTIYWVVFHTQRIGSVNTLSIYEKAMSGPILCAGVLDRMAGFSYKTSGQQGESHRLQKREGFSIWEQQYRFSPAKGATLAWKQARPGQPALPTNPAQEGNAPSLGQRDWLLIAVDDSNENGQRIGPPEKVLAVYGAPKGMSKQAKIYFVEELGTDIEVGALAIILGIVRWNYTKPAKLLGSSSNSSPAYMG